MKDPGNDVGPNSMWSCSCKATDKRSMTLEKVAVIYRVVVMGGVLAVSQHCLLLNITCFKHASPKQRYTNTRYPLFLTFVENMK